MNRLESYPMDDDNDIERWGPDDNRNLARLLCSNPRLSLLDALDQIWGIWGPSKEKEDEAERVLCREIERDWDVHRYERLYDFLVSADGSRIRKLLVINVECVILAQQLVVTCNWLSIARRCRNEDSTDPKRQARIERIREQFPKEEERFRRLCRELETALKKLN